MSSPRLTPQLLAALQMRACLCEDVEAAVHRLLPLRIVTRLLTGQVRFEKKKQLKQMVSDCKRAQKVRWPVT